MNNEIPPDDSEHWSNAEPPELTPPPHYTQVPQDAPAAPYGYAGVPVDRFGRPLAGWWQRFVAIIIDFLILGIPKGILAAIIVGGSSANGVISSRLLAGTVVVGILFSFVDLAYFALLNGSERGQTLGQIALGIAVRDERTGDAIDPKRAGIRILVLSPSIAVSWIPVLGTLTDIYTIVSALSPLWDSHRRGFHDKAVHTNVIKVR